MSLSFPLALSHVPKCPYPLDQSTVGRREPADSRRPIPLIGSQILNMFNTENRPTLHRIGRQLWRIGRRLYYTHTHTSILEESALESALESADYSSESANFNDYSPRIGVWVRALSLSLPAYLKTLCQIQGSTTLISPTFIPSLPVFK